MTQEQINKLTELKKLLDAGILTEEEMLAEKAKVLGYNKERVVAESSSETEVSASEAPVNGPENEDDDVSENESDSPVPSVDEGKSNGVSTKLLIISLCAVGVLIAGIFLLKGNDNERTSFGESTQTTNEDVAYNNVGDAPIEEVVEVVEPVEDDDDEFAYDPWSGTLKIEGVIYRMCQSMMYLNLQKKSKGMYDGEITIFLGEPLEDYEDRFDPFWGTLEGRIRAKAESGVLTVVMDSYKTNSGDYGNFFDGSDYRGQIFRITNSGSQYAAEAIGAIENLFSGPEDVCITK